jgi:hypothetical protein
MSESPWFGGEERPSIDRDVIWKLDSMDTERLTALRAKIDELLKQGRPKPKWPGGETLWHKVWKQRVRCVYEEADEDYRVRCWWDLERGEWSYQDKYSGDPMFESDLEEWTMEKEEAAEAEKKRLLEELKKGAV